ncbi:hypothetical protein ON010_g16488 [Phytophthora cinnamomi]|nr:hypothetical protein ON010_g16488 [Phytophthora cinnamomi]
MQNFLLALAALVLASFVAPTIASGAKSTTRTSEQAHELTAVTPTQVHAKEFKRRLHHKHHHNDDDDDDDDD